MRKLYLLNNYNLLFWYDVGAITGRIIDVFIGIIDIVAYKSIDLKILFDYYFKPEKLTDENNNLYLCGKCASLQKAIRTVKLSQTSDYCIITLKFKMNQIQRQIINQKK
jgi:ubiquitin C-terminal hydrolase